MGVMQKMRERMEKRKEMQKGLKDAGYKNTFLIRNSKGLALLQAQKVGVDINKFRRMTSLKEVEKARAESTKTNIRTMAENANVRNMEMNPSLKKEFLKLQELMNTNPSKFGKDWGLYRKGIEEANQVERIREILNPETEVKIAQTARTAEERGRVIENQKNPDNVLSRLNQKERDFKMRKASKFI